jgi:UDP-N-acetylglucosamine 1-carboxyvinyltransferase
LAGSDIKLRPTSIPTDGRCEPCIVIDGHRRLCGTIPISGSKNAALALLAGALLAADGTTTLRNLPRIADIAGLIEILGCLGVRTTYGADGRSVRIDASSLPEFEAPASLVSRMRGSLQLLGPLLARKGRVRLAQPGGCNIGARAIDLHEKGLRALGAVVETSGGSIFAEAPASGLRGAAVYLDKPSVGATMNLMMAAALADGETIIENAAQEPDVEDLANLLVAMGGDISGQGTGLLRVRGVRELHGAEFTVSADRIEGGTYAMAAAITGGDLFLEGANAAHLRPILMKLSEVGLLITEQSNGVRVTHPSPGTRLPAVDVVAMPHPGFPTDLQQPFCALSCIAEGTSAVTDKVYEGRFRHLTELTKMGAKVKAEGQTALITGVEALSGAAVEATDLRAGAGLVLAGLAARGVTKVYGIGHIDRGYEHLTEKLAAVGASIWREDPMGNAVSEEQAWDSE